VEVLSKRPQTSNGLGLPWTSNGLWLLNIKCTHKPRTSNGLGLPWTSSGLGIRTSNGLTGLGHLMVSGLAFGHLMVPQATDI
jgi:hypothetical protein